MSDEMLRDERFTVMDGRRWSPPRAYLVIACRQCGEQWGVSPGQLNSKGEVWLREQHAARHTGRPALYADLAYDSPAEEAKADRDEHAARNRPRRR